MLVTGGGGQPAQDTLSLLACNRPACLGEKIHPATSCSLLVQSPWGCTSSYCVATKECDSGADYKDGCWNAVLACSPVIEDHHFPSSLCLPHHCLSGEDFGSTTCYEDMNLRSRIHFPKEEVAELGLDEVRVGAVILLQITSHWLERGSLSSLFPAWQALQMMKRRR